MQDFRKYLISLLLHGNHCIIRPEGRIAIFSQTPPIQYFSRICNDEDYWEKVALKPGKAFVPITCQPWQQLMVNQAVATYCNAFGYDIILTCFWFCDNYFAVVVILYMTMSNTSNDKKNISRHILPTSSNLLGITFVIFSMIKVLKLSERTLLDELTAINMILFLAASLFSYASIRTNKYSEKFEKVADGFFLVGLTIMTFIALIISFEVVK